MEAIFITVLWCAIGTSYEGWNPHQTHVAEAFMASHRGQCFSDPPLQLEPGITLAECQSQAMIQFLPGWNDRNPGGEIIGIKCEARIDQREHLDLRAMKHKVSP